MSTYEKGHHRRWFGGALVVFALFALVANLPPAAAVDDPEPGAATNLAEVEPNDTPETANPIAYGQTVEGEIARTQGCGEDDYFVFHGSAGDHVQAILSSTSALSSYLSITDGQRQLARGYEFGGSYGYGRIFYTLPADGDYYLRAGGYNEEGGDGCDGRYTLQLGQALALSAGQNATLGGVSVAKSDIVAYDQTTGSWEMLYDLSNVGLENNVGAFFLVNYGFYFAPLAPFAPTDEWVAQPIVPQDLATFWANNFGPDTRGGFSSAEWANGLDGSDVGLTTSGEAIDAVAVDARGWIVISTRGACSVPGVASCADEDLIAFNPVSLGPETIGSWEMYFDGSDLGLGPNDIRGVWLSPEQDDVYFTLESAATISGLAVTPDNVVHCQGGTRGDETSCATVTIDWAGAAHGLNHLIDGLGLGLYDTPQDSGYIDLTNHAHPNTGGLDFTFTGDLGSFHLGGGYGTQFEVPYGDYAVTVQPLEDWTLDIVCRDPDGETLIDLAARTFTVDLDLGEWVYCDVYNIRPIWYVSAPGSGVVDGLSFDQTDILAYYPGSDRWDVYADGSELGLSRNLASFSTTHPHLHGFSAAQTLPRGSSYPPVTYYPQDIASYDGYFGGIHRFNPYFDGSDVGLTGSSEAIDAIGIAPDGRLLISTTGTARVPGAAAQNEDILAFSFTSWESVNGVTAGTWALYFDGSTIPGLAQEDVVGLAQDSRGDLFLTLRDSFTVAGIRSGPSCVIVVHADGTVEKAWDARDAGFPLKLDGIDVPFTGQH